LNRYSLVRKVNSNRKLVDVSVNNHKKNKDESANIIKGIINEMNINNFYNNLNPTN